MRWKPKQPPRIGDLRLRRGFLLFPRRIGDDVRWLEKAAWRERYAGYWDSSGWEAYAWDDQAAARAASIGYAP